MNKEVISDRQGISLVVLFIIGTNSIMAAGLTAEEDIWIAVIIGIVMGIPMMLIFARLHCIFENKDLFDTIEICFGKVLGKVVVIILTLYAFEAIASIVRNFAQFPVAVSLNNSPLILVMAIIMILCVWAVKEGIEVISKWARVFLLVLIILIFMTLLLSLNIININYIRPVLRHGIKPVLKGAYEVFMFPFTQTVVFIMAFSSFKTKKSSYKIYLMGLLIGGLEVLLLSLLSVLVLGVDTASGLFYPAYAIWLRINIGDIFERMEIIAGGLFTIGAFIKLCIFLMATSKGVSNILGFDDYKLIVAPIAFFAVILAGFEFDSMIDYFEFTGGPWYIYAFPLQVGLPIIIWIVAEIKKKRIIGIE
ncbi:GerAB/ArcD/ProY family transporter [Oceanirhabdus seepicola]|uniref:Endospore germination permease n=1 Tax=Oceanirhabdus seepicola TaxID=2828781 RepID=A0A9J6NZI3_9CLOT|nr:endospore germination permease [Oceanirhabdus seepicola]MCM1988560.1 endospore germination permease [Oceanirhabdus seepicola]